MSLVTAVWLFLLPQFMASASVRAHFEEWGTSLPLMCEEEEVHAVATDPLKHFKRVERMVPHEPLIPAREERVPHTLHGEVPHPPPWG